MRFIYHKGQTATNRVFDETDNLVNQAAHNAVQQMKGQKPNANVTLPSGSAGNATQPVPVTPSATVVKPTTSANAGIQPTTTGIPQVATPVPNATVPASSSQGVLPTSSASVPLNASASVVQPSPASTQQPTTVGGTTPTEQSSVTAPSAVVPGQSIIPAPSAVVPGQSAIPAVSPSGGIPPQPSVGVTPISPPVVLPGQVITQRKCRLSFLFWRELMLGWIELLVRETKSVFSISGYGRAASENLQKCWADDRAINNYHIQGVVVDPGHYKRCGRRSGT